MGAAPRPATSPGGGGDRDTRGGHGHAGEEGRLCRSVGVTLCGRVAGLPPRVPPRDRKSVV